MDGVSREAVWPTGGGQVQTVVIAAGMDEKDGIEKHISRVTT